MRRTHEVFAERRDRGLSRGDIEHIPYPFHPGPGGLISWGYDCSGDEHFFRPCSPDPDRWKVVTMAHEEGCQTFGGPFSSFALANELKTAPFSKHAPGRYRYTIDI